MAGPVSELITDAVLTVLPDIATVAVRANMVDDALCIGSLACRRICPIVVLLERCGIN